MRAIIAAVVVVASAVATLAAPLPLKVVVFDIEPFELAPTHELQALLADESAVLRRALADKGLAVVETKPRAADIAAQSPLGQCDGCGARIARALGADLVVTTTVQEIEYPRYSVFAVVKDAASGHVLRKAVVAIDGDGADDWARGLTMLVKERLLAQPLPADANALHAMVAKLPIPPE